MTRVMTLFAIALGALVVAAGLAIAHEPKFETTKLPTKKVTIKHPSLQTFSGKVKAKGDCKVDRTVKVSEVEEYGGSDTVGAVHTDESGVWEMTLNSAAKAGNYQAVAKKSATTEADGDVLKCKKGVSKVIHVG